MVASSSRSGRSTRSDHSQSSRHVARDSVLDEDEEPDCVSSVLGVDNSDDDIDEGSEEGTTEHPIEMIEESENEEDADAELRKAYLSD